MSYDDGVPNDTPDRKLGRRIYKEALDDRRGFRDDQIGIEDPEIWAEIFTEMGRVARRALMEETP